MEKKVLNQLRKDRKKRERRELLESLGYKEIVKTIKYLAGGIIALGIFYLFFMGMVVLQIITN